MRHIFQAHIAPELIQLRGLWNSARLSIQLRQVVSIRFPFRFREGELASFIVDDDDINIAATLRGSGGIVSKTLLTVFPALKLTPDWTETEAAHWAYGLGGSDFERVIRACFQPQPPGAPQAFDPLVIQLDNTGDAALIASLRDENDHLRQQLALAAPPMDGTAATIFVTMVRRHGWQDERQLRSHLADAMNGQWQRERFVLLTALAQGIPADIAADPGQLPAAVVQGQLAARLSDATGIALPCAAWAISAWWQALH